MPARKASSQAKRRTDKPPAEHLVDEALEDTFPASDPPFFVGGVAEPGTVQSKEPAEREGKLPARRDKH